MHTTSVFLRHCLMLLLVLLFAIDSEGKKPVRKKTPPKTKTVFTTAWNNIDSLNYYYALKKSTRDFATALRIGDSLMVHPSSHARINQLYLQKINLLDSLGNKPEVLKTLINWEMQLGTTDSLYAYSSMLSERFASAGNYQKAYEISTAATAHLQSVLDRNNHSLDSMQTEFTAAKVSTASQIKMKQEEADTFRLFLWIISAIAVLLLAVALFFIVRQFRMKKQHEKLGAQMDHTRLQIDKAFEEGDRINLEIRSMKEQMARIEVEKKIMKQSIQESTSETLPLLRQQLDALARESSGAIPVEKYLALQTTITRLNKQLKDFS